ncbi:hypothetical protein [Flavobacterium sp.]|uniref:hypothetical protein n=1 Tax=Flavobacterium sp. TaxID=239 RepID=UPI003528B8C3
MTVYIIVLVSIFLLLYFGIKAHKQDKEINDSIQKSLMDDTNLLPHYSISKEDINNFTSLLLFEKIIQIKVFQVNDTYHSSNVEKKYIIDGGIEFTTTKGYFTLAYSTKHEQFIFSNEPFLRIYENDNYFELKEQISSINNYLHSKIINVSFKEMEFDEIIDYTMATEMFNKIVEVTLTFDNNQMLQLSLIEGFFETEDKINLYKYSIDGEILVSFSPIKI